MIIERFINQPVPSNTYIVFDGIGDICIVIDPGSKNCSSLIHYFDTNSLIPKVILLTHEHFDHIWGCNHLVEKYGSRIICSEKCKEKIAIPQNYYNKLYYDEDEFYSIDSVYATIEEINYKFKIKDKLFKFIKTPGHSSSSICIETEDGLFTGDTLMNGFKPLILKRHEGSKAEFKKSVDFLFQNYPLSTKIYPGHGDPFILEECKDFYSRYLSCEFRLEP